jgi:GH25 family lysozyme M1 (1,4-beta-N-acetylmuramidase)
MLHGVDVHNHYQRGIDFVVLARQGYSFAVVKASEGTSFIPGTGDDPTFASWIRRIRAAEMIPGAYHWLKRGSAAAQARHFHNQLVPVGGSEGLIIQLDCEDNATWADLQAWHDEWNRLSNNHPYFIYTGSWWWNAAGRGWSGASLTPYLWHSHYLAVDADTIPDNPVSSAARIPASWWTPGYGGWSSATIIQYTSRGDAGRLGNNVDLNATRLTRDQLLALTTTTRRSAVTSAAFGDVKVGQPDQVFDAVIPDAEAPSRPAVSRAGKVMFSSYLAPAKNVMGASLLWCVTSAQRAGLLITLVNELSARIGDVVTELREIRDRLDRLESQQTSELTPAQLDQLAVSIAQKLELSGAVDVSGGFTLTGTLTTPRE